MKKNLDKIISMILIICFSMCLLISSAFAADSIPSTGNTDLDKELKGIIDILVAIAGVVCVVKLIQIGILYMLSTAQDRSSAKGALVPWAIGAIICGGYAVLGNAIISFFKDELGFGGDVLNI